MRPWSRPSEKNACLAFLLARQFRSGAFPGLLRLRRSSGYDLGVDFRAAIIARLKEGNLTRYKLAQRLRDTISQRALYDYLSRKTDTSAKVIEAIFEVLELSAASKRHADMCWLEWQKWEEARPDKRKEYRRRQQW